jgi:hypothetical protein
MEEDNLEKEKTEKISKNKSEVQGDGLDDAKEAIEINGVDVVREDLHQLEGQEQGAESVGREVFWTKG